MCPCVVFYQLRTCTSCSSLSPMRSLPGLLTQQCCYFLCRPGGGASVYSSGFKQSGRAAPNAVHLPPFTAWRAWPRLLVANHRLYASVIPQTVSVHAPCSLIQGLQFPAPASERTRSGHEAARDPPVEPRVVAGREVGDYGGKVNGLLHALPAPGSPVSRWRSRPCLPAPEHEDENEVENAGQRCWRYWRASPASPQDNPSRVSCTLPAPAYSGSPALDHPTPQALARDAHIAGTGLAGRARGLTGKKLR